MRPPRIVLAVSAETDAVLEVAEVVMHDAEEIVDDAFPAIDDLVGHRQHRVALRGFLGFFAVVAETLIGREAPPVIVKADIQRRTAWAVGIGISLPRLDPLDLEATILDRLPLRDRLF